MQDVLKNMGETTRGEMTRGETTRGETTKELNDQGAKRFGREKTANLFNHGNGCHECFCIL